MQVYQHNNRAPHSWCCAAVALLGMTKVVLADWNYAVYFDPEEEPGRNPFGEGFSPRGPKNWNEVNFYGGFLSFPRVDYSDNICTTDTAFQGLNAPTDDHQQSPIEVEDGPYWGCNDRHKTHNFGGTSCDYRFGTSPYGLMAQFNCGKNPFMDMSRTTTEWELDHMEVKTPAEHVVGTGDYKAGNFKTFDGEIRLVHKGTKNDNADHTGRIAVISILLEAQGNTDEPEFERFIKKWETAQEKQYNRCNLAYNDNRCRLERKRRRLGDANSTATLDEELMEQDIHDVSEQEHSPTGFIEDLLTDNEDADGGSSLPSWMAEAQRHLQRGNRNQNEIRPYRLIRMTGTEHYYGYDGGMTVPPCAEKVWYRILRQPLIISRGQLRRINDMIARHLECSSGSGCNCNLATVGRRTSPNSCHVAVNRPLQYTDDVHHVTDCIEWHVDDSV